MSKNEDQRFEDTIRIVPQLVTANAEAIKREMETFLTVENFAALSKQLSLGFYFNHSAAEQRLRHMRRALLLAKACKNGLATITPAEKSRVSSLPEVKIKQEFGSLFPSVMVAVQAPFACNFHPLTWGKCPQDKMDERQAILRYASEHVRSQLLKAIGRLARVGLKNEQAETLRFNRWFGSTANGRLQAVRTNFRKVLYSPKPVMWYYHGPLKAPHPNMYDVQCSTGLAKNISMYNDQTAPAFVWSYTTPGSNGDIMVRDPDFFHICCGEPMFKGRVTKTNCYVPGVSSSVTAVLIHELTHCVFRSNDEKWPSGPKGLMYGSVACMDAAANGSDLVLTNAANYQFYADEP